MAEEDTGEVVDSAVFTRNASVQERLNINIDLVDTIMFSGLPAVVRPSITAGSDDYDIIGTYQYYGISAMFRTLTSPVNTGAQTT